MSDEFAKDFLALHNMVFSEGSEDRVVAIVCAAYLERHLVDYIAEFFPGLNPALKKSMFDETTGMAGTLGKRLDLANALNAITPGTYSDGLLIGRIRNKFAHHLEVTSFEHPKVRDLVDNLQTGRDILIDDGDGTSSNYDAGWDRATRFRTAATGVCSTLMHHHIKEHPYSYSSGASAIGTGMKPPSLDKLNKPPPRAK